MSSETRTHADKKDLYERLLVLEYQIQNNTDEATLSTLRKEYREIHNKLELFYDDEPKEVKP